MNKKKYESPTITKVSVEVESGFMSASVVDPVTSGEGVSIKGHEITHDYGFEDDPGFQDKWDD